MIAVPSKGRAGKSATLAKLADYADQDVVVAAPVAEWDAYAAAYPWITSLIDSGPGIGRARQAILDLARLRHTGPFWMLDDDITSAAFYDGRSFRTTSLLDALYQADLWLNDNGVYDGVGKVAIAGLGFRHLAWAANGAPAHDVNVRNFAWVNPAAPVNYWTHLKEDVEFVLSAIESGWHSLLLNHVAFDSPRMGTTEGGCWDDYLAGNLDAACMALVDAHPDVVSLRLDPKSGQLSNRIDWRKARELAK